MPKHLEREKWRSLPPDMAVSEWKAADGWTVRRFDWPAAPGLATCGSLLFQGGRGDFIEKYLEAIAHWRDQGWHVSGFDWRGQGGSGRLLANTAIGHADSFDRWLDDLDAVVTQWIADRPGPHVLMGHSMGGHLVLRLLAERRPAVDAAVLAAPMLGYAAGPLSARAVLWISRMACRLGLTERSVWGGRRGPEAVPAHRQRNLTHSAERYADELWWRSRHPELAVGAPSWGWMRAGAESMARLASPGVLECVQTPLLIVATPQDGLVAADAIRNAAARLPQAELRWFPGAAHELLRESDDVLAEVFAAIDAFLETVA
ncbi:alpha/beta fold hydrolase [Sphingomonas sp. DBB INV C78]|uniref:alpha/beta fold hydrolase n=1 Tax=Sphingomonas sp. DBB INV C78 TaxID=3349434 RepID=UPI0036D244FC